MLDIVLIVGPLVIGTSLSTLNMPVLLNITVWSACVFISICGVYRVKKGWEERKQDIKEKEHLSHLLERQELRARGLPEPYINGLGDNPLLKNHFNIGQRYEKENNSVKITQINYTIINKGTEEIFPKVGVKIYDKYTQEVKQSKFLRTFTFDRVLDSNDWIRKSESVKIDFEGDEKTFRLELIDTLPDPDEEVVVMYKRMDFP